MAGTPSDTPVPTRPRPGGTTAAAVALLAFLVYSLTAARTITFWEGAHYSLLARTLSISNPPGSLLLTLIGRVLGDVPFAAPMAFRLNLIAAMIGATGVAVIAGMGSRVAFSTTDAPKGAALAGGAVAALVWAFAATPWTYATQFNPYGLSALFTALILAAFLNWWRRAEHQDAAGAAALIALLLGLDLSVHRSNLVLLPALALGILLRRPRALVRPRFLAGLAAGFVLGGAVQLLYIPLSRREPFLDIAEPNSLAALWRYARLDPIGGGFLVDVWPRRADFVHVQLGDIARFARLNLGGAPWGAGVALALGVVGWGTLLRRTPRLAFALLGFTLAAGLGVVVYLNRPATYFRSLDRHYLAFLVTLMPLLATGIAATVSALRTRAGGAVAAVAVVLAAALPLAEALVNARTHDLSHTRFAETYGRDMLDPLPRGAVVLTNGDNDSFPPWYLQLVEGVRRDVTVVNVPTAWTTSGTRRVRRTDPALASFVPSDSLIADMTRRCLGRRPVYFAVTLFLPAPVPGISERLRPEGLVWRVSAPGDTVRDELAALGRFIHDRLPRAGFDDPRQRLDDDLRGLGQNYAAAALRLASVQLARHDARGALETLAIIDRSYPSWRFPPGAESVKDMVADTRRRAEEMLRDP